MPSDAVLRRRYEGQMAVIRRRMWTVYAGLGVSALALAGFFYVTLVRSTPQWVFLTLTLVFAGGIVFAEVGRRRIHAERDRLVASLPGDADPGVAAAAAADTARLHADEDQHGPGPGA